MPINIHSFNTSAAPGRVFQAQLPQRSRSLQAPTQPDYAGFGDTLVDALKERQKRGHPHTQQRANRMLNRQPLNASGFRSTPAAGRPQGLFAFKGLRGLF